MSEKLTGAELSGYGERFEKIIATARELTGLNEEQACWHPSPSKWCIAECISHLNITAGLYRPKLTESIEKARSQGLTGEGPFKHRGILLPWLIRQLENPQGKSFKAPGKFKPVEVPSDFAAVMTEFMDHQQQFLDFLKASDGLDLGKARVVSPVTSLLRMSLGQCFRLNCAHQERHLRQVSRMREDPSFPAA